MKTQQVLLTIFCAVLFKSVSSARMKVNNQGWDKHRPESLLRFESLTGFRLPNNSIPLRYDLWLKTDVDKANFDFSGQVKIHIRIVEPTQQITLHYRRMAVDNVDLYDADQSLIESNLKFEFVNFFEFLVISLPRVMTASEEIILDIKYHSELRTDSAGFYRSSYEKDDEEVWLAVTKFHTTDARHAMPCYDEPAFRAVFNVEIQHDKSYNAISNMPLATRQEISGTDYVTSKFEDTPSMSTYLLAFIISDYAFVSNNNADIEQRIYARPEAIANGDGDFAASVVDSILKEFEEYFGVDFPLSKLDHVAIENLRAYSQHSFGLNIYPDSSLKDCLVDE